MSLPDTCPRRITATYHHNILDLVSLSYRVAASLGPVLRGTEIGLRYDSKVEYAVPFSLEVTVIYKLPTNDEAHDPCFI